MKLRRNVLSIPLWVSGTLVSLGLSSCNELPVQYSLGNSVIRSVQTVQGSPEPLEPQMSSSVICETGAFQSPIAIDLDWIEFTAEKFKPQWKPSVCNVFHLSHTIEVSYGPGSFANLDGREYQLEQFHFHSPSEHIINGKQYPLEAHFVHSSTDPSNPARLVIAVLFEPGADHGPLQTIWNADAQSSIHLNVNDFLPETLESVHYEGSLTTPPYTGGVQWLIYTQPVSASEEQMQFLQFKLNGPNNREIQPLNGRTLRLLAT
jgi:carbonic anhydrase